MLRSASLAAIAAGILFSSPARAGDRAFANGYFVVTIGGESAWVQRVEGGDVAPEIVEVPTSDSFFVKKHLGNPKYEDFTLTLSVRLNDALADWIRQSLEGNYTRKDGAIVAVDMELKPMAVREFQEALITEIGFPAVDGASKDPAFMTIKFSPLSVKARPATAADAKAVASAPKLPQPQVAVLCVDGIPCGRLLRMAPVVVHLPPPPGQDRAPEHARASNLVFSVSEDDAQEWLRWYQDFVVDENNDDSQEKAGSLHYLTPSLQEELFQLDFHGLGIFKATREHDPEKDGKARTVRVELYVEEVSNPPLCRKCP